MLMVSKALEVARGRASVEDVAVRHPVTYGVRSGHPGAVIWNVGTQCNMTCQHCYAVSTLRPCPSDLETRGALALIDRMTDLGVKVLVISGGEPLMRSDLAQLVAHSATRGMTPMLSSNGVLLDRDAARELADAGLRDVAISVDGLPAFNDPHRGLYGAFDRAVTGLRAAKAAGMRTGLAITMTRHNADQLLPVLDVACTVPVDRFYVSHLVYARQARGLLGHDLPRKRARAVLRSLFEAADRLLDEPRAPAIATGCNDSFVPLLLDWIEEWYGVDACRRAHDLLRRRGGNTAGETMLSIDADGKVQPGQFWRGPILGNVREHDFATILAHPFLDALRSREERLSGRCGACRVRGLCRGSLRERAHAAHGDFWAPNPSCVMTDAEVGWPA